MSIMGLVEEPGGKVAHGKIDFQGEDLLQMDKNTLRAIRGNEIAMIFQEPMSSLNPVIKIGEQIMEPLIVHLKMNKKQALIRAIELIKQVGISRPEQIADSYPHELSGGMLQRIMIAIAIACSPKLLIADEPTTALDVTIQAQILDMLREIKDSSGMSILLITHDLGVVAEMADYVIVMYSEDCGGGRLLNCSTIPNTLIRKGCSNRSQLSISGRMSCIPYQVKCQIR